MQPELQSGTMIFKHVLKVRKAKRIAMFDGFEPRRCEDIKGIVAPGTYEKQVPVGRFSKVPKTFRAQKGVPKTPTRSFCKAGLFI